eukprot:gnl/MRDRNA2_/MRDRNA2_120533_c0_seq1.p1 gnl/MRDRNA2_/MRDRNA2_120533_c0~~gnl/MRDRNA2_/MRDRNA2_120533_c0_seq1.p1  ORF type:complete len:606 (-),score=92.35 gnl/MRDRNA2_/MRDRNA2_120533_c0_seq1:60-1877(-)
MLSNNRWIHSAMRRIIIFLGSCAITTQAAVSEQDHHFPVSEQDDYCPAQLDASHVAMSHGLDLSQRTRLIQVRRQSDRTRSWSSQEVSDKITARISGQFKMPACGTETQSSQQELGENWLQLRHAYKTYERLVTDEKKRKERRSVGGPDLSQNAADGVLVPHEVRISPGKGRGLFATVPLRAGTRIWTPQNEVRFTSETAFREFLALVPQDMVCKVLGYAFTDQQSNGEKSVSLAMDDGSFINHGGPGEANVGCATGTREGDCFDSVSLRDIQPGEELLDDYTKYNVRIDWWDAVKREAGWALFNNLNPGHNDSSAPLQPGLPALVQTEAPHTAVDENNASLIPGHRGTSHPNPMLGLHSRRWNESKLYRHRAHASILKRVKDANACAAEVSMVRMCQFFDEAYQDSLRRESTGFKGWRGTSPSFQVPYEIRQAGFKGLGVFTPHFIKKGTEVYHDISENFLWIPDHQQGHMKTAAMSYSRKTMDLAMGWCGRDWLCNHTGGIICELDGNRYINHSKEPNLGPNCPPSSHPRASCALRDIQAHEELVEDYGSEELDSPNSVSMTNAISFAAGECTGAQWLVRNGMDFPKKANMKCSGLTEESLCM